MGVIHRSAGQAELDRIAALPESLLDEGEAHLDYRVGLRRESIGTTFQTINVWGAAIIAGLGFIVSTENTALIKAALPAAAGFLFLFAMTVSWSNLWPRYRNAETDVFTMSRRARVKERLSSANKQRKFLIRLRWGVAAAFVGTVYTCWQFYQLLG